MRIVRVIVGVLLVTLGMPALVTGGAVWLAPRREAGAGLLAGHPALALTLLTLGTLAIAAGGVVLATASRTVVFVVEPAHAAALAAHLGVRPVTPPEQNAPAADAPEPDRRAAGDNPPPDWPPTTDRPRTLADTPPPSRSLAQEVADVLRSSPPPVTVTLTGAADPEPTDGAADAAGQGSTSGASPRAAATRARKTAGGLPLPDELPVVVPPPTIPPKRVMIGR